MVLKIEHTKHTLEMIINLCCIQLLSSEFMMWYTHTVYKFACISFAPFIEHYWNQIFIPSHLNHWNDRSFFSPNIFDRFFFGFFSLSSFFLHLLCCFIDLPENISSKENKTLRKKQSKDWTNDRWMFHESFHSEFYLMLTISTDFFWRKNFSSWINLRMVTDFDQ